MLQHDPPSEDALPIPQRRITPEELKRSIAALDARKQAEQQRLAETLSVGQAVDDLSLEYTPEEIWEEVAQQRAAQPAPVPELMESLDTGYPEPEAQMPYLHPVDAETYDEVVERNSTSDAAVFTPLIIASVVIVGMFVGFASLSEHSSSPFTTQPQMVHSMPYSPQVSYSPPVTQHNSAPPQITATLDAEFYRKLEQSRGPNPAYHIITVPLDQSVDIAATGTLYPMPAIPDGYSIHTRPTFYSLFGYPRQAITFHPVKEDTLQSKSYSNWPNIITTRYDGQPYLRCWIDKSDIPAFKTDGGFTLYLTSSANANAASQELTPITIPFGPGTHGNNLIGPIAKDMNPAERDVTSLKVPIGFHLLSDKHTWEDFPTQHLPHYKPSSWAKIPGVFSGLYGGHSNYADFDASSLVEPISALPNRQVFHCGEGVLREIAEAVQSTPNEPSQISPKASMASILIDARPDLKSPYTLIKIDGNLYLRGWVSHPMSESLIGGRRIMIRTLPSERQLGESPTQIQFRMDKCEIDIGMIDSVQLPVSNIHLDNHAWEHWKA